MPDNIAYWVGLAVAAFGGGFLKEAFKWLAEKRKGIVTARRDEVSRAIAEKDRAIAERNAALDQIDWWFRWARILEEAFGIHRRRLIDNGLPVDPYPDQPDRD